MCDKVTFGLFCLIFCADQIPLTGTENFSELSMGTESALNFSTVENTEIIRKMVYSIKVLISTSFLVIKKKNTYNGGSVFLGR